MKICWDNLECVTYNRKSESFRYKKGKTTKTIYYKEECKQCGEPFLALDNKRKFCDKSCANKFNLDNDPERKEELKEQSKRGKVDFSWVNPEKAKQTKLERYGDENFVNAEKIKETKLERHGDENFVNIEKRNKTNLEKYGHKCCLSNPKIKEKALESVKENYNENDEITNVFQVEEVKEKCEQVRQEKYGDPYYNNREKAKETCIENYGVPHHNQNPEIYEKVMSGIKKSWHDYQLPSGEWIRLQGFEPLMLNKLLEDYDEEEIFHRKSDMPEIWYIGDDNKHHRYYPDFYIPRDNLVIEVKSDFTYNYDKKRNELKEKATKELGYNFYLMIFDENK